MADSLVLKGVKDVIKHTGSEMVLMRPKRGGDTHQLKKWWLMNANNTVYVSCSLFKVTSGGQSVFLAIDSQEMSTIRIDHDGAFNFTFYGINGISRAALYDEKMALIEHYAFPKISGGKIMTVIPPGASSRPGAGATTIGSVSVSGATAVSDGATEMYAVNFTGDASDATIVLTSSVDIDVTAGLNVTFNGAGPRTLTATVTSPTAVDSGAVGTLSINATRTVAQCAKAADQTVVVTVNDGVYEIDEVAQDTINMNAGETLYLNLSDASLRKHPLAIYTDCDKTTVVSVGIETSDDGKILLFTPPIAGTFNYQCTKHPEMGGEIIVS